MELIEDVLDFDLAIVYCGTALGNVSYERMAYYANPANKFWRTLYAVGLTPRQLEPQEYKGLIQYRQGLTDMVKQNYGLDSQLSNEDYDHMLLRSKMLHYQPKILCFNSKNAAKKFLGKSEVAYGFQEEQINQTRLFVAPSTSGAANGYWDERVWRLLGDYYNSEII
ncbi:MAG: mismatch-specific DNA-glycosylase [Paenibacillaceae bacterium]